MRAAAAARFVRRTLGLLMAAAAALICIIVASIWLSSGSARYAAEVARERAVFRVFGDILAAMVNAETGQRGFLLTRDDNYLRPYEGARQAVEAGLDRLDGIGDPTPETARSAARLRLLATSKLDELEQTVTAARQGNWEPALDIVRTDRGMELMAQIRGILDEMRARGDANVNQGLAQLVTTAHLQILVSILGGALILVFALSALWIVMRYTRDLVAARQEVETLNQGLEERVAERTAALSRANDEIQRFAYIVSHDLRAPLVNIMGFTSELEVATATLRAFVEEGRDAEAAQRAAAEEVPEAMHFIRASTGKMDRLIAAILKLSRLGRSELRPEEVDLRSLLGTVVESMRHQIDAAGADVAISGQLPPITSDRVALEQVFGNLIDNAVKYLMPGRPGRISIEGKAGRHRVIVTIADNGRGIASRDLERVFELFRRAGTPEQPGEGIGLAHVRALARRLGGDVALASTIGEGSRFQVELPRYFVLEKGQSVPVTRQ